MIWQRPTYEEVRMDAEIGSYQADDDGLDLPPFVREDAERAPEG
jgi:hypothetical protein